MRFLRLLPVVAVLAAAACDEPGKVTHTQTPPLAYIRYVHAVPNSGAQDFMFQDGIEYSPQFAGVTFRSVSIYQGARAGSRHITVFVNSSNIVTTQTKLVDTTLTLTANTYYTLLHAGYRDSTGAARQRLIVLEDTRPAQGTGIHVSVVNASTSLGGIDAFLTAAANTPLTGLTPLATNVANGTRSAYVAQTIGTPLAVQAAATTTTTSLAGLGLAAGVAGTTLVDPVGGTNIAGTQFSAYLFPRSVAGSPATNFTTPGFVVMVDKQPPRTVPDV